MKKSSDQQRVIRWLTLGLLSLACAAPAQVQHRNITPEQLEFFEKNIRPVLVEHCYDCHSEEKGKNKGELTLDTRDGIRAGGDRGPAVVPGKPDDSILINAIRQTGQLRMPPDSRGGMLPDDVIANFEKWVADGAPDPRDSAKIISVQAALTWGIAPAAPGSISNRLKSDVPPPMSTTKTRRGSSVRPSAPCPSTSAAGWRSSQL